MARELRVPKVSDEQMKDLKRALRAGGVIQAGIVFGGERLALAVLSFAALNIVLTGFWLGVVAMLNVSLARKQSAGFRSRRRLRPVPGQARRQGS